MPDFDPAAPQPATVGVRLSLPILQQVCPHTSEAVLAARLPALQQALDLADASSPLRAAAAVAELAYESAWLTAWVEVESPASGVHFAAYEPPTHTAARLGNTHPGDGALYRGRGLIQLTGRSNYRAAGIALSLPLEEQPDLAAEPETAARVAAWYWSSRHLNVPADAGNLDAVTLKINGGENGEPLRLAAYERARKALGA